MTPPKEYFEQVPEGTAGAQRVGPYWFAFISPDSLFDMLNGGLTEKIRELGLEIRYLKEDLARGRKAIDHGRGKIEELEAELAELKAKQVEK